MHYYQFNIADYRKDTGHLTTLEHGIYRQLIDWIYLDEQPIPLDTKLVRRRLRLGSEEEAQALINVLTDFFVVDHSGYTQKRIFAEIKHYHANAEKNKANGIKGGRPPSNPTITHSVNLANPNITETKGNQEPITNNHKPITNINTKALPKQVHPPVGVSLELWADYMTLRKSKKSPMTATSLKGLERESKKAGITLEAGITICVERNWVSLKAEWILQKDNTMTTHQIQNLAAARSIFGDERQHGNFEKIT